MNREAANAMSAADIRAFGPAPDNATLETLLGRLADIALANGNPCLWGWLLTLADIPDVFPPKLLEEARDAIGRSDLYAVGVLDAAVSILRRP